MGKQKVLSSKFNMSLGYIPVIISIILCEFIMQDIAIYIGTGYCLASICCNAKAHMSPRLYYIAQQECYCY